MQDLGQKYPVKMKNDHRETVDRGERQMARIQGELKDESMEAL
jgi:hypothetical protein